MINKLFFSSQMIQPLYIGNRVGDITVVAPTHTQQHSFMSLHRYQGGGWYEV